MKFLILVNNYPSPDDLYAEHFVHTRIKEYSKQHQCLVVSYKVKGDYEFEGVPVIQLNSAIYFNSILNKFQPDRVLVHFALKKCINLLRYLDYKIIVWVHGYEALGWYRRWFDIKLKNIFTLQFLKKIAGNTSQQYTLRRFIQQSNNHHKIDFVFVSDWMLRMTEADTFSRIRYRTIIPNPIDDHRFDYQVKDDSQRYRILLVRPFTSKKYALDIARDTILELATDPIFNQLEFSIYGQGPLWPEITHPLEKFKNVRLYNFFLNHEELRKAFIQHGLFLCPSRQDAQGVTMCEAMCSGLIPITSNHTGLTEFVQDDFNAYTTISAKEMAARIKQLASDPVLFQRLSHQAALSIRQKAGIDDVIRKEMAVILS